MSAATVFQTMERHGVVPVVAIGSPANALGLADALIDGGLPVVEITFRTAAAAEAIRTIRENRPEMLVGAGTVLDAQQLQAARDAGAQFAVAPGLNEKIVEMASASQLPMIPGVATPSDVEQALSLGLQNVKLFPAELVGGAKMVKALAGPYGHRGVRFMPTGGITVETIANYLRLSAVFAVGGTWIARSEDLDQADWSVIQSRAREAVDAVSQARGC